MNNHAPAAVEGIDLGGRSFDRSRSNSCVSGVLPAVRRTRHERRDRHRGRNWHNGRQDGDIALPDCSTIKLNHEPIGRIDCTLVAYLEPDMTRIVDPGSRWHSGQDIEIP